MFKDAQDHLKECYKLQFQVATLQQKMYSKARNHLFNRDYNNNITLYKLTMIQYLFQGKETL